jgi:penicillin-binding protein 1A
VLRWLGKAVLWLSVTAAVWLVIGAGVVAWLMRHYADDLPAYASLADYQPPTVTRIHAGDGRLLAEYAHERRVFVPMTAIPPMVRQAFVSAEDKNFYGHPGIDPMGIARAAYDNLQAIGTNRRPQGASTITQQVAKNFFLTNEVSIERKLKEAMLAFRIERAFTKDRILELYLNEIFLGRRSYGVAAAALTYFDKTLDDLTLAEAAFLAALPKAPTTYDPDRSPQLALDRRNYVLGRMLADGAIAAAEHDAARATPIETRSRDSIDYARADFFTEEVRRQLVRAFGEEGFYQGGLSVRTTVDPRLQALADRTLRNGLAAYDRERQGWRGPLGQLDLAALGGDWQQALAGFDPGFELEDWRLALVLEVSRGEAAIGLVDGSTASLPFSGMAWATPELGPAEFGRKPEVVGDVVQAGDVIVVEEVQDGEGSRWALRQRPSVEGALVALDPHTGRVLAMAGGFSFRQSQFNRATQAYRQPGSSFKPFIYLAALENGFTPSSIILDAPLVIDQGPNLPLWKPENYSDTFYGPSTLRTGIEQSRNLMTVRLAREVGMGRVREVARRFGVDRRLDTNLAASLGSNEIDLLNITEAYAMLVNGGREIRGQLVERIQDRFGQTVLRRDARECADCRKDAWDGAPPPALPDTRPEVVDPRHAYQMVTMLEGVVARGTGTAAQRVGKPVAGKTGTTNDSRDAWFVGFSPDLAVGVYVGFDRPRNLGRRATGGSVALPIWTDFMTAALADAPATPFRTPPGVRLVRVDAATGLLPGDGTQAVIAEAFLPGTEPATRSNGTVFSGTTGGGGGTEGGGNARGITEGGAPTGLY